MGEIEQIDDFLEGKLDGKALEDFKSRVSQDQEFAQLVQEQTELKHGIRHAKRMELKNRFKQLDQEESNTYTWRIAASVLLLAVAGFVIWLFLASDSNEELFLSYYEPPVTIEIPTPRGSEADVKLLQQAISSYSNGEFDKVEEHLAEVSTSPVFQSYAGYIRGITKIGEKDFEQAVSAFEIALETEVPIDQDLHWYRALCLIQLDRLDEAKESLRKLSETPYSESAEKILKELQ